MGDPRRLRNSFKRPKRLWEVDRIKHDKVLKNEFGLKSMNELFAVTEHLKKYRREARRMLSLSEEERAGDEEKIIAKLVRLGIVNEGARIEDILALEVRVFLERRLQTLVVRKGLARTMKQARQLITHGFITFKGRKHSVPGTLVNVENEDSIMYSKQIDLSIPSEDEAEAEEKPAETEEKTAA
jgi:small subunit ribosomal protein S4